MDSDDDLMNVLDEISVSSKKVDRGGQGDVKSNKPSDRSSKIKRVSSFEEIFDEISIGPISKPKTEHDPRTLSRLAFH